MAKKTVAKKSHNFTEIFQTSRLKKAAIVLLVIGLLYSLRSLFVAATVNGQPITRPYLVQELERQGGKQTLNTLITKTLIFQEAKKQGVTIEKKEIDEELTKVKENLASRGQNLDQILQDQGLTKESLEEQIRMEKLIEKLIGKNVQISDGEVEEYIEKNKESFPDNQDSKQVRETVKAQLRQQKMSSEFQVWLEDLRKAASIKYFVNF